MCDRANASMTQFAASQIGFINAVVQPLLDGICLHLPSLRVPLTANLDSARAHWVREAALTDAQPPALTRTPGATDDDDAR